jgi:uncharacterized membrane protein
MPETVSFDSVMRVRRQQPTRLEGFVDASFAFAVTLVVISLGHVPGSVEEMLRALRGVPTFAICFLLLARVWFSHRNWSRHYDLDDATSVVLSLILVFVVLIYVYPLRILFAQMFMGFSGGWLSDGSIASINTVEELRGAYTVFGFGLIALSGIFLLLYRHALLQADAIGLSDAERLCTRMRINGWQEQIMLGCVSLGLTEWLPMSGPLSYSLPGMVYSIAMITGPLRRRYYRGKIERVTSA